MSSLQQEPDASLPRATSPNEESPPAETAYVLRPRRDASLSRPYGQNGELSPTGTDYVLRPRRDASVVRVSDPGQKGKSPPAGTTSPARTTSPAGTTHTLKQKYDAPLPVRRSNQEGRSPLTGTSHMSHDEFYEHIQAVCSRIEIFHDDSNPENLKSTALAKVDIIMVAGLGGHYISTWEAEVDGTVWPRDLLREHIDEKIEIRVFSFHYNTTLRGTTSKAGIRDHANDLLSKLYDQREDDQYVKLRYLVFVGHSLGGMIIKRAITAARENRKYRSIWEASIGVMFFATPHNGLNRDAWEAFATRILKLDAPGEDVEPSKNMLKELNLNSNALKQITHDFWPVQKNMGFVTFSEEEPLEGLEDLLVERVYALSSPHADGHQMLSGDHISLCKFSRDELDYFYPVATGIESLLKKVTKPIDKIGDRNKLALYSLNRDDYHSYFLDKKPTKGTCRWITDRPKVRAWKNKTSEKPNLWIQGPPGSGKSFLARQIITQFPPHEVVHCFLSAAARERSDLEALLRATLQQILRLIPELIEKFLAPAIEKFNEHSKWTLEILQAIWPEAVAEVTALKPLAMVVDGFDELKKECQDGFLECLERLKERSGDSENLRLLVVSGQDPGLSSKLSQDEFDQYTVTPEDVRADMEKTVKKKLRSRRGKRPSRAYQGNWEKLCESIVARSKGSYRWATMAADEFTRNDRHGGAILESLPQDLPGLHRHRLQRLNKNTNHLDRQFIRQALIWASFQCGGLKEGEFNVGQAMGIALDMAPSHEVASHEWKRFAFENVKAKLARHCGQIVEIRDGRLELVHESLKMSSCLETLKDDRVCREVIPDEETAHSILAEVCITFLTMPCFEDPGLDIDPSRKGLWESKVRARLEEHEFLRYSVLHWQTHLGNAGDSWSDTHFDADERRMWLDDKNTGYGKSWREVWWFLTLGPIQDYPSPPKKEAPSRSVVSEPSKQAFPAPRKTARAPAARSPLMAKPERVTYPNQTGRQTPQRITRETPQETPQTKTTQESAQETPRYLPPYCESVISTTTNTSEQELTAFEEHLPPLDPSEPSEPTEPVNIPTDQLEPLDEKLTDPEDQALTEEEPIDTPSSTNNPKQEIPILGKGDVEGAVTNPAEIHTPVASPSDSGSEFSPIMSPIWSDGDAMDADLFSRPSTARESSDGDQELGTGQVSEREGKLSMAGAEGGQNAGGDADERQDVGGNRHSSTSAATHPARSEYFTFMTSRGSDRLRRERFEREGLERSMVKMERKRLERERLERERLERERLEREGLETERLELLERQRLQREQLEKERLERLEKERSEQSERDRLGRLEKERLERLERERLEHLKKERLEELERERLERLQRERLEQLEKERLQQLENDRLDRLEKERLERWERLEKERLERLEWLEKERLEQLEKERLERLEKERLEKERLERLEQDRLERLEMERLERLERERLERENSESERERLERERQGLEKERLEIERLERGRVENYRLAREREHVEMLGNQRVEQEEREKGHEPQAVINNYINNDFGIHGQIATGPTSMTTGNGPKEDEEAIKLRRWRRVKVAGKVFFKEATKSGEMEFEEIGRKIAEAKQKELEKLKRKEEEERIKREKKEAKKREKERKKQG